MNETYQAYLDAVLAGDRRRALEVIVAARHDGADIVTLYVDVFQPALREIGNLWERNTVTVAEEHLATAITESIMARLYTDAAMPSDSGYHLVAACAELERHAVGLRMLCDLMDLQGWTTTYIGASVPSASLARMICDKQPDVVALSATLAPHIPQLRNTIEAVRAAYEQPQPLILVGGRAFLHSPELAYAIGADLTASDAREAARLLKQRFK